LYSCKLKKIIFVPTPPLARGFTSRVRSFGFYPKKGKALPIVVTRQSLAPAGASVVDDLHFGVTHVIRGADLYHSTLAQQWLAQQVGWTDFQEIRFLHHPLLTDAWGEKLSKSAGATALRSLAAEERPTFLFRQVAAWLDVPMEGIYTADDLLLRVEAQ